MSDEKPTETTPAFSFSPVTATPPVVGNIFEYATKAAASATEGGDAADDDAAANVEAEAQVYFEPVVQLDEVEVKTHEEEEEVLFKIRAKLFAFRESLLDVGTGRKQWLERGVGDIKILKHNEHKKIRVLMRQEKTLKIICNHLVAPKMDLSPNVGSDRSWVWNAFDFSDGEVKEEYFAVRFANAENAKLYKEAYDAAREEARAQMAEEAAAESAAADAAPADAATEDAAAALDSLKVADDEKAKEETATAAE